MLYILKQEKIMLYFNLPELSHPTSPATSVIEAPLKCPNDTYLLVAVVL